MVMPDHLLDEGLGPRHPDQLLLGYEGAGSLQQCQKNGHGAAAQTHRLVVLEQQVAGGVDAEATKMQ